IVVSRCRPLSVHPRRDLRGRTCGVVRDCSAVAAVRRRFGWVKGGDDLVRRRRPGPPGDFPVPDRRTSARTFYGNAARAVIVGPVRPLIRRPRAVVEALHAALLPTPAWSV